MSQEMKKYEVQAMFRGDWIPILLKEEKGKKRQTKTVKITEATAAVMNIDAESWSGPNNPHLRYVLVEGGEVGEPTMEPPLTPIGAVDTGVLPNFGAMKKALKEAGVKVDPKAKKPEVEALYREHILGE